MLPPATKMMKQPAERERDSEREVRIFQSWTTCFTDGSELKNLNLKSVTR